MIRRFLCWLGLHKWGNRCEMCFKKENFVCHLCTFYLKDDICCKYCRKVKR